VIAVICTTEGDACLNKLMVDFSSVKSSPRAVTARAAARGSFSEAPPIQDCFAIKTVIKETAATAQK
jgi:hypothetical protein